MNNKIKILFLDIDGVLNSYRNAHSLESSRFYEKQKLELVKEIVKETDCKVVLTSMRLNFHDCKKDLTEGGLEIYDSLMVPFVFKDIAIQTWLKKHSDIEKYVILDDNFLEMFSDCFVKTSSYYGLTKRKMNDVINIFNGVKN